MCLLRFYSHFPFNNFAFWFVFFFVLFLQSNSFKFERFRRDDTDAAIVSVNTLPKQVSTPTEILLINS